ncbi:4'-phosphopantetheinyl transferase [Panus rudis PR-1116 ss-1]|nr:4'-phosphopantetheinyl transferase [Panus rudis PR-1116 ss-1]
MTIIGVGVDVLYVPRLSALIKRRSATKLATRILSSSEHVHWQSDIAASTLQLQTRFLAVRWAVKEAAYKALYPTIRPTWKMLTLTSFNATIKSKPSLHLVEELRFPVKLHVSISHDGEYVFATVLAENVGSAGAS